MNAYYRRIWWSVRPLFAWRLLRLLCRAFWLAAGLTIAGRLISSWAGWPLSMDGWALAGAAAFGLLFLALALWPISLPGLAQRMDRALGLRDQITTAHEIARRGPGNYVEARLIESAGELLRQANRRFWRSPNIPWGDLEMSALAVAILYALAVMPNLFTPPVVSSDEEPLPPVAAEPAVPMPGLPPQLSEGLPAFAGPENGAGEGGGLNPVAAQEALDALTEALNSQSLTQQAGAALAQGDTGQAAQELRELADSSSEISPETQQALGQSLQEAAREIQDSAPGAAQELVNSAQALQGQGPAEAAEGLEGLAQLAEDLGEALSSPEGLAGEEAGAAGGIGSNAGREQSAGIATDRLPGEGEALELPQGEELPEGAGVLLPPDHEGNPEGQRSTPFTQPGAEEGSVGQISDPLNYPWRLRSVVQRYFSAP